MNMSKEEVGAIIVRILGIVSLLIALSNFTTIAQLMVYSQEGADQFSFLGLMRSLSFILPLALVGFWFLSSAEPIGARLMKTKQNKKSPRSQNAREWQELAFSVPGVYLLVSSISSVVNLIGFSLSDVPKPATFKFQILSTVLVVSAGFWLALGADGIVALIRRLRRMPAAS